MGAVVDYRQLALKIPRAEFVSSYRFPFLVGGTGVKRPQGPQRTMIFDAEPTRSRPFHSSELAAATALILAVRKVQTVFASMITVGRTSNNDIVIADEQVSKFHAHFRVEDDRVELSDHSSRNGTWVGEERLAPGIHRAVLSGETVRFASIAFTLLDAGALWDRLRR